jgi:uncharacterized protein (TIGR02145 family)
MRKAIYIFLILLSYTAYSQNLSVYNIDVSAFPTIKANFFAFDSVGNQITNLSIGNFELKENGLARTITYVTCPEPKPTIALSSVLVIDVSGSMKDGGLDIAKAAAYAWIDMLPLGKSECAITSFSENAYLNQDFTTKKVKLIDGIYSLDCVTGTDYDAAFNSTYAGALPIARMGKHKRVIVFLSDGVPNSEPNTTQIINDAIANNITIYGVIIGMAAPQCVKDFSTQTGGLYFENIRTKEEAEDCYRNILMISQGGEPCEIEWKSEKTCIQGYVDLELNIKPEVVSAKSSYKSPDISIMRMDFSPPSVKFLYAVPGIQKDTTVVVTAKNADFIVSDIKSSNPAYTISPTNFVLNSGQAQNLKISYLPADSGYTMTKFTLDNDKCTTNYFASGGFPGKKPKMQTLKLINPNGGEEFIVGMDTLITWEGIMPDEKVVIDYTTNNGANWIPIADSARGLSYNWNVPKTPSNQCLARVTANSGYETGCPTILINNQLWMGCNLDVEVYRNGDTIPQVTDPNEWISIKTGAWCYYNNDPAMGAIYGKLYNHYALSDIRGLIPEGWHLPSDEEWTELENFLGGTKVAGGKLKSTGTIESGDGLWFSPNKDATNESNFSAEPAGIRDMNGNFLNLGYYTNYWTSTGYQSGTVWIRSLLYLSPSSSRVYITYEGSGFSVRCILD